MQDNLALGIGPGKQEEPSYTCSKTPKSAQRMPVADMTSNPLLQSRTENVFGNKEFTSCCKQRTGIRGKLAKPVASTKSRDCLTAAQKRANALIEFDFLIRENDNTTNPENPLTMVVTNLLSPLQRASRTGNKPTLRVTKL